MNTIPLIQNTDKQSINTSIIALKRQAQDLETLVTQLNDKISELEQKSGEDYLKRSDLTSDVESGNENPVTSGGVYSAISSEASARDTAISNAVNALDVSSVGGSGKYISAISETDGKISATASDLATSVTSGDNSPVTSGAVYTAIQERQPFIKNSFYTASTYSSGYIRCLTFKGGRTSQNRDVSAQGKIFLSYNLNNARNEYCFYFNIFARYTSGGYWAPAVISVKALDNNNLDTSTLFTGTYKLDNNAVYISLYSVVKTTYQRVELELERITSGDIYPSVDLIANSNMYSLPMNYSESIPSDETVMTATRSMPSETTEEEQR